MYSNDMKFVDSHEWVVADGDIAKVGITLHAKELLGDMVYVELPKVGDFIKAKQIIGVVESVKAASDLYSPICGEVIAVNDDVINDPTLINSDPHGCGWLIKVKLDNASELDTLLSNEEYQKLINSKDGS